jgi:hypothetical protein
LSSVNGNYYYTALITLTTAGFSDLIHHLVCCSTQKKETFREGLEYLPLLEKTNIILSQNRKINYFMSEHKKLQGISFVVNENQTKPHHNAGTLNYFINPLAPEFSFKF